MDLLRFISPDFSEVKTSIFEGSVWLNMFIVSHLSGFSNNTLIDNKFIEDIVDLSETIEKGSSYTENLQFIQFSEPKEIRGISQSGQMEKGGCAVVF